ncbi:hypothetical protein ZOSMA_304G00090 [Zostera marina]|uniref:Uncharacterized protein n=1 Tax=Zostera marina TaxID=29655 RepID=A0A0K9PCK4_ZOSMR|nr:hypothetical protein ZOSMA_304G00090 [Zostera marina]
MAELNGRRRCRIAIHACSNCSQIVFENKNHDRSFQSRSSLKTGKRFCDLRELQYKKRVAKYKMYNAESKMKASLKRSLKWFKKKCVQLVNRLP